ncbi:hypothetical protein EL22_11290 [Halostagnicola sp. A56]|nr:hypothetical protein EL22_11290 [Halostagnicola sp. A56]
MNRMSSLFFECTGGGEWRQMTSVHTTKSRRFLMNDHLKKYPGINQMIALIQYDLRISTYD